MRLHRDLGVSYGTAWFLAHRIKQGFLGSGSVAKMQGPVQTDESYFGGLEKNKHETKKQREGRDAVGKTAVVGIKDRPTNTVKATVVDETTREQLVGFVDENREEGATVYTDEATVYESIAEHESVAHGIGKYVKDQVRVNGTESSRSMLKRAHKGTFHELSPKHLDR